MILVVGGEHVGPTNVNSALPEREVYGVTAVADAREWCTSGDPEVVVLDCDLDSATDFIRSLRDGTLLDARVPIVAVVDDPTVDSHAFGIDKVIQPPVTTDRLRESIEGAMLLEEYKSAVDEFFDRCEEQASDDLDTIFAEDSVSDIRAKADQSLEELREKDGIPFDQLINDA